MLPLSMPLFLLLSFHSIGLWASPCDPEPFSLPIKDVQVEPNVPNSLMRGIPARLGTPEQDIVLMPWAELNNTWIYDQQTYCDPTIILSDNTCLVRRGNPFLEANSRSFSQTLDIASAGGATQETSVPFDVGISELVGTGLGGTESLNIASSGALSHFPIGIPRLNWDAGYTTLHALGFGSNSTYLNSLKDAGRMGARVWSIYWGRMWTTDNPLDGAVVLGGYDESKVIGQNHTQALDYSSNGCWTGIKVNIADIIINRPDGFDSSLLQANTIIPICIVPQRQLLLEAPTSVMSAFETLTNTSNIGVSFGLHWSAHLYNTGSQFDGDITIVLDSGLSVRVPNDQYVVPFVSWDDNGAREFNESQREVLIASVEAQPATLGRYFLTAAYLMVDQDAQSFTLWQANPTTSSRLVRAASQTGDKTCSNTTTPSSATETSATSTSSSSTSRAAPSTVIIAGVVVGVSALLAIAGLVAYCLRRRSQRQAARRATRPVSELLTPFRKYELHNDSLTKGVPSYVTCMSSSSGHSSSDAAELHETSISEFQGGAWRGPVYELSAGTPPLPPPK